MADRNCRIAVTGIGLATAFGDRDQTWEKLTANASAIRAWDQDPSFFGAPLEPRIEVRPLLLKLADQALNDAGLLKREIDPERVGVVVGLSKGDWLGLTGWRQRRVLASENHNHDNNINHRAWGEEWLQCWPHGGASAVAERWGWRGPCLAPVAACASGVVAVIQAGELLRSGRCDAVLVGAADVSLEPMLLTAFRRMRVLARGAAPESAVRPWDRDRSGFAVGEGGAILVLEPAENALARGVEPWAEFAGGALGSDGRHETSLNSDPANLSRLIRQALRNAETHPNEIDHVNLHGAATRDNDPLECRALRAAFGPYSEQLACSANKSQIGHLLGAAGAVELAIACLSLRHGFVTPTLNLDRPDPVCDLDATPHIGRPFPIRASLKMSLGFGGHFAVAIVRAWT